MANKISFLLKDAKSNQETLIRLRVLCYDGLFDYSTMQKVLPSDWNSKIQRSYSDASVNDELNRLKRIVEEYLLLYRRLGKEVSKSELKTELDERTHRVKKVELKPKTIQCYVRQLAKEASEGKLITPQSTIYTEGAIKNWERSSLLLQQYNPSLTFDEITLDTYYDFVNFCNLGNYSTNFIGKVIKDLKRFMVLSHTRKWHDNIIYKHPEFKKLKEDSFHVYLNMEEIEKLMEYDLSGCPLQEKIRDRFIINLLTGFRISDMQSLSMDHIDNGNIIHINKKTNKKVVVPIHPFVTSIIKKYNGNLPKQYADQVVNREIKKIAQAVGFTEKVRFIKTTGGKKRQIVMEKWQMISNHTCRRSMATNLLKDADMISTMLVLGMTSKTLERYNKRTPEENAELLKKNKFYQR